MERPPGKAVFFYSTIFPTLPVIFCYTWRLIRQRILNMKNIELENEFIALIENYQRVIYKVCYLYSKDKDNLNDLYQESILNLWRSYPRFRNECKASTWIYKITLNTCISFFRRFSKSPKFVPLSATLETIIDNNNEIALIHELYNLINRLGNLEKALILLYLEEKSYQEIANITGLSLTNVATRLCRIKEKLKRMSNE